MNKKIVSYATLISIFCIKMHANMQANNTTSMQQAPQPSTLMSNVMLMHTTPSGLSWIQLQTPTKQGSKPAKDDMVTVHYTGWVYDENAPDKKGRKFDSSHDRNRPFPFKIGVGQVIKGWDEGVLDMAIGEQRRLIIPASLAYGARGVPSAGIPADATLVFDVELISFEKSK